MKNVIKKLLDILKLFGDFILSTILFVFYLVLFFPYKLLLHKNYISGWKKVDKYNLENKNLPF